MTDIRPSNLAPRATDTVEWSGIHRFIRQYVFARSKRHDLADDIAQETVARLIEYGRANQIATIHGLGIRIARNLLLQHGQSASRIGELGTDEHVSDDPLPDHVAAVRQEIDLVSKALQGMPKLRREVLVRRRINGESCARIAQELNLSIKAVEKHITRGLRDLHEALNGRSSHD